MIAWPPGNDPGAFPLLTICPAGNPVITAAMTAPSSHRPVGYDAGRESLLQLQRAPVPSPPIEPLLTVSKKQPFVLRTMEAA
jgi:hypothetical protein